MSVYSDNDFQSRWSFYEGVWDWCRSRLVFHKMAHDSTVLTCARLALLTGVDPYNIYLSERM